MTEFILRQHDVEKKVRASRQGREIEVEIDGATAVFQLIAQSETVILLERTLADGTREQWRLLGHKSGEKRTVWVNGRTHHYERLLPRGGKSADGNATLAAAIPAVVADILVNVGDTVAAGDKLILLESMKMIIPIQAPHNGIVTALNCVKGDSVQAGVQLITLDENKEPNP